MVPDLLVNDSEVNYEGLEFPVSLNEHVGDEEGLLPENAQVDVADEEVVSGTGFCAFTGRSLASSLASIFIICYFVGIKI